MCGCVCVPPSFHANHHSTLPSCPSSSTWLCRKGIRREEGSSPFSVIPSPCFTPTHLPLRFIPSLMLDSSRHWRPHFPPIHCPTRCHRPTVRPRSRQLPRRRRCCCPRHPQHPLHFGSSRRPAGLHCHRPLRTVSSPLHSRPRHRPGAMTRPRYYRCLSLLRLRAAGSEYVV